MTLTVEAKTTSAVRDGVAVWLASVAVGLAGLSIPSSLLLVALWWLR